MREKQEQFGLEMIMKTDKVTESAMACQPTHDVTMPPESVSQIIDDLTVFIFRLLR